MNNNAWGAGTAAGRGWGYAGAAVDSKRDLWETGMRETAERRETGETRETADMFRV